MTINALHLLLFAENQKTYNFKCKAKKAANNGQSTIDHRPSIRSKQQFFCHLCCNRLLLKVNQSGEQQLQKGRV